jgi:hypothetical protein
VTRKIHKEKSRKNRIQYTDVSMTFRFKYPDKRGGSVDKLHVDVAGMDTTKNDRTHLDAVRFGLHDLLDASNRHLLESLQWRSDPFPLLKWTKNEGEGTRKRQ